MYMYMNMYYIYIYMYMCCLLPLSMGQALMASVVNPPREGDPSFPVYQKERDGVLAGLKRKAELTTKRLNEFPGVSCQVCSRQ